MSEPVEIVSSSDDEDIIPAKKPLLSSSNDSDSNPPKMSADDKDAPADGGNGNLTEITRLYEGSEEIQEMLRKCYEKIHVEKTKDTFVAKVRLLKNYYDAVGADYVQSEEFKKEMRRRIDICDSSRLTIALQMFIELFTELQTASKRFDETAVYPRAVRKLEKFLKQIHKKIVELEETEVNFDDDENSSYIRLQRYRERAAKVYEKLCKYRKESAYSGDITKRKIDFSGSDYVEINRAINKAYKNGSKFPTYCDVEKCIRKCVKKNDIEMSENELKIEAKVCFEKLGNLLQNRRKLDLLDRHSSYLKTHHDPAEKDSQLNDQLNKHKSEASKAISDICQKYVKMQEEGKEVKLSDDSDDSNYETTDEDDPEK